MINAFLSLLVAVLSFSFFSFTLCLSKVNKTLVNMPKGIFESSINLDSRPFYFDKDNLENKLLTYIDSSLSGFYLDYDVEFFYYSTSDHLFCKSSYCDGVEVTLDCDILFHHYHRVMFYEIRKTFYGRE